MKQFIPELAAECRVVAINCIFLVILVVLIPVSNKCAIWCAKYVRYH